MGPFNNIRFGSSRKQSADSASASGKEFQKLRRVDLLELLVDQVRENEELTASVTDLKDLSERLKAKLDQKDAQIERLKGRLDMKDAQIAELKSRLGEPVDYYER